VNRIGGVALALFFGAALLGAALLGGGGSLGFRGHVCGSLRGVRWGHSSPNGSASSSKGGGALAVRLGGFRRASPASGPIGSCRSRASARGGRRCSFCPAKNSRMMSSTSGSLGAQILTTGPLWSGEYRGAPCGIGVESCFSARFNAAAREDPFSRKYASKCGVCGLLALVLLPSLRITPDTRGQEVGSGVVAPVSIESGRSSGCWLSKAGCATRTACRRACRCWPTNGGSCHDSEPR
jgi:hypothetical protein